jgi:hypothetical protein
LLDRTRYSHEAVASLYEARWQVELVLCHTSNLG